MNSETVTPTNNQQPTTINYQDLIGSPYTKEHDCNWVVAEIYRRAGEFFPQVQTPDDPAEWPEVFQQAFLKYGRPVTDITPLTVMTFCFRNQQPTANSQQLEWHMGVMVTRLKMLTTTLKMGVHIINRHPETPLEGLWWAHFRGAYRVKPTTNNQQASAAFERGEPTTNNQQPTTSTCSK